MTSISTHASRPVAIVVTVNHREVTLTSREVTGLEVKQEAIAQGVAIDLAFQLSEKKGHKFHPVADTDSIRVHPGTEFRAVAGDDNS